MIISSIISKSSNLIIANLNLNSQKFLSIQCKTRNIALYHLWWKKHLLKNENKKDIKGIKDGALERRSRSMLGDGWRRKSTSLLIKIKLQAIITTALVHLETALEEISIPVYNQIIKIKREKSWGRIYTKICHSTLPHNNLKSRITSI